VTGPAPGRAEIVAQQYFNADHARSQATAPAIYRCAAGVASN
jgi:hypothetical protein